MVPDLIVPDLTDFKLKPYVAYDTKEFKRLRNKCSDRRMEV